MSAYIVDRDHIAYYAYRTDVFDQLQAEIGNLINHEDTQWGARLGKLDRSRLVELVESVGAAAFEDEPDSDLIDCITDSVKTGDIDPGDI